MKIVEHGNTIKEMTCEFCHCIFEYCEKDIKTKRFLAAPFTDYDLDYTWSSGVHCPECDSFIILNDIQTDYLESIKDIDKESDKKKVRKNLKDLVRMLRKRGD